MGLLTRPRVRPPLLLAYASFVLIGISAGGSGVLLLAQMSDYGVDRATIGITFFTVSAGFVLAGLSAGALIARYGVRITLAAGAGAYALSTLYMASRPPFAAFVVVQVITGFGFGVLESALNTYLAAQPGATTKLNRLHAFFGVGALIGPVLAAWVVGFSSWRVVCVILAVASVPLVAGSLVAFPGVESAAPAAHPEGEAAGPAAGGLLGTALRERGVLLGSAMLAVYVGLEIGMGNWAFSYLVQSRSLSGTLAGYAVSGYWLGLTVGRFVISPVAAKKSVSTATMIYACLAGVIAASALAWVSPGAAAASVALMLLGFFLAPVFPTTMSIAPQLTRARLVPTAIGVMNAASTVGGAALPWLEGLVTQSAGIRMLMPFTLVLALLQFVVWWPIANRIRAAAPPVAEAEVSTQQAG